MNILFWIYKSRINNKGLCPIMLRITLNGKRLNLVTGIEIEPEQWDKDKQKVRGGWDLHKLYNKQLLVLKTKSWDFYTKCLVEQSLFNLNHLKSFLFGQQQKEPSLLDAINYHIEHLESRIGIDIAPSTVQKYHTIKRKILEFLKYRFTTDDIILSQLNFQFIYEFDHFMRVNQKLNNNGVSKNMQQLKRIIRIAMQNEWLKKDPFDKYSCKIIEPKRTFLTKEELIKLEKCLLSSVRLQKVRDLFIFSCYTGLAYSDVTKLQLNHFQTINEQEWIILERTKTKNQSIIPLLPQAKEILLRYKSVKSKSMLLPVISSQNINKYLKELSHEAKINKSLTFHAARHTFASTVMLNNGVDITSVSAMLGHKMLKTTQIYAKVNFTKLTNDTARLFKNKD